MCRVKYYSIVIGPRSDGHGLAVFCRERKRSSVAVELFSFRAVILLEAPKSFLILTVTTQQNILSVLRLAKPELEKKYRISRLALFGSYSRNTANENSDVDLMVEFYQPPGILFIDLADELEEMLDHKVDLVSRKAIKPSYFQHIQPQLIYV